MAPFRIAHASRPDWRSALDLIVDRLRREAPQASFADSGSLGLVYVTDLLAEHLGEIGDTLGARVPGVRWAGASSAGICAGMVEYHDVPAIAAMVCPLPENSFRLFPDRDRPAGIDSITGSGIDGLLLHVDPGTRDFTPLLDSLAARIPAGRLFGGVVGDGPEPAPQLAGDLLAGGISGVAFQSQVMLRCAVTQACAPLGKEHRVSASRSHYLQSLDGRPALDVLLDDLDVPAEVRASRDGDEILRGLPADRLANGLMVGFAPADLPHGFGFGNYLVRNVVGIDPVNRLLAVAGTPRYGERVVFCTRDRHAARADLVRVCTELRDELESGSLRALGAHYVSCVARGEQLFGAPGAELELIAHNLGELPLVGFFANGEIADGRLYGYTGVLTLFVEPRTV